MNRVRLMVMTALTWWGCWASVAAAQGGEFTPNTDLAGTPGSVIAPPTWFGLLSTDTYPDAVQLIGAPDASPTFDVVNRIQGPPGQFSAPIKAATVGASKPYTLNPFVAIADVDATTLGYPGANEIVVALVGDGNQIQVLRKNRRNSFVQLPPLTIPEAQLPALDAASTREATAAATGDVTGDGRSDAVFVLTERDANSAITRQVVVVVATGPQGATQTLTSPALPQGTATGGVRVADLTGDGRADIVLGGANGLTVMSIAGGAFGPPVAVPDTGSSVGDFSIGEVTGDTTPDLLVVDQPEHLSLPPYGVRVRLLIGMPGTSGVPSYEGRTIPVTAGTPCAVAIGDVSGDAHQDLVLRHCPSEGEDTPENGADVYLGNDTGAFPDVPYTLRFHLAVGKNAITILDIDHDGHGDIMFTGGSDSSSVVFMNRVLFQTPPIVQQPTTGTGSGTSGGGGGTGGTTVVDPPVPPRGRPTWRVDPPVRWRLGTKLKIPVTCAPACLVQATLVFVLRAPGSRSAKYEFPSRPWPQVSVPQRGRPVAQFTLDLSKSRRRRYRALLAKGYRLAARVTLVVSDASGGLPSTPRTDTIAMRR